MVGLGGVGTNQPGLYQTVTLLRPHCLPLLAAVKLGVIYNVQY